jgi:CelD/BcsL family acetyltransferase involved in cellulose biosynthesis/RimJ/RimL family protein N-acetyltransferase
MDITIKTGSAAVAQFSDRSFQQAWKLLYEDCSWATRFQDIDFVCTWYDVYKERFTPIIISQYSAEGALVGLLTAACHKDAGNLVMAGAHQAEYQVWLASQSSNSFIRDALLKLRKEFPRQDLVFTYLPTGTPLNHLLNDRQLPRYCSVAEYRRPLLTIDAVTLSEFFRKKNVRNYFNRLKALGEPRFERITDMEEFERLLPAIIAQCDFRQGAVNNSFPFKKDPLKKPFHIALMRKPDLLHVTVLKIGDELVAANLNLQDKKTVHTGVLTHSPIYARYRPGTLHLLLLGMDLAKEGFSLLDLTPGGGDWKERFATEHDVVHQLTIYGSVKAVTAASLYRKLRKTVKQGLNIINVTPNMLKATAHKLKRIKTRHLPVKVIGGIHDDAELRIYRYNANEVKDLPHPNLMEKNNLADLLVFEPTQIWQTCQDFLRYALNHLEEGHHIYTRTENGRLVHYGWLIAEQESAKFFEVDQQFRFPKGSALLLDFWTHPEVREKGLYRAAIEQMLHDAAVSPGVQYIYIAVLADDTPSRDVLETLGFQYQCSLFREKIFGITRKWSNQNQPIVSQE